jgi:hypothetical protein
MRKRAGNIKRLKVGYAKYKLTPISKVSAEKRKIQGEFSHNNYEIVYDESLVSIELLNTILHEIFHAVFRVWDVKMKAKEEELTVERLTNGLVSVLIDNPKLGTWINKIIKTERARQL